MLAHAASLPFRLSRVLDSRESFDMNSSSVQIRVVFVAQVLQSIATVPDQIRYDC